MVKSERSLQRSFFLNNKHYCQFRKTLLALPEVSSPAVSSVNLSVSRMPSDSVNSP